MSFISPVSASSCSVLPCISQDEKKALLFKAVQQGDLASVDALIFGGVNLNIQDQYGKTPLSLAASNGCAEIVRLLLEKGAELNTEDKDGQTPLYLAAMYGHTEIVRFLIEKGADLNTPNKNGQTPLCEVACNGHTETVKLLLEKGADLNIPNKNGWTLLHKAAMYGHTEIVKLLLEKGADLNTPTKFGLTPLHLAVCSRRIEMIKLLIEKGADLNTQDNDRCTPLFLAASRRGTEIVKLLAEKGAQLFIAHPLGDLVELNPLFIKLAGYEDPQMTLIRDVIFSNITSSKADTPLRCLMKAIQNKEAEILMRGLKLNRYGGLDELLKERQQIRKLLAKAKKEENEGEIKKQKGMLKKLEKPIFDQDGKRVADKISSLQAKVKEAKRLIESGDIQGAKKLLEIKRVEGLRCDADVCSYLVGMIAEETSEDLGLIIDTFAYIKLKNVFIHRTVSLAIHNLLEMKGLNKSEKIALLKKIVTPIREWSLKPRDKKAKSDQGNLQKDFYRAVSTLNLLTKLGMVSTLKELIDSPTDVKKIMEDLFKQKFDLEGVDNLYKKYEETLGNNKKFRDPTALFIYLGSLETIGSSTRPNIIGELGKKDVIALLSTYVRDVLEGSDNFIKNRYDLKQSPHLKTIFESKPELLELWKENRSAPVSKSAENQSSTASKVNYLEIFKQKIITDSHLGADWQEKYPFLAQGLVLGEVKKAITDIEAAMKEIKSRTEITLEIRNQAVETLEAQQKLLRLCEDKEIDRGIQISLLKESSLLFSKTELQNDLNGLVKSFSSGRGGVKGQPKYSICDTDDPCDILLMGDEINGSCQRLDGRPSLNAGLLGPLLDGKYRIIAVKDETGKMVARCLLKILWDEKDKKPVLFQERLYINQPNNGTYHSELLNEMCRQKAQAMGLPLLKDASDRLNLYSNPISSLGGRSPVEYVDALYGITGNTYAIRDSKILWAPA